ncbi:MAG: hypothetical protein EXS36_01065 [Pedosphaera sp.]|nr:hypothetical protein [Pedosphaera sp.]
MSRFSSPHCSIPATRGGLRHLLLALYALLHPCGCTGISAAPALPAAPTLDTLFPISIPQGATSSVTIIGKFEPWPPKLWTDAPNLEFIFSTNIGQIQIIAPTLVTVGPHLIRAYNDLGSSEPRFLLIDPTLSVAEIEPNDAPSTAQPLPPPPFILNGRFDKSGDVDSFRIHLKPGQTLFAALTGYALGSPIDPWLRLIDTRGVQLAANHDDGRTLDPELVWTASADGDYFLQAMAFAYPANSDIKFAGGDAHVYRLAISTGPRLKLTLPLGVSRTGITRLQPIGWNSPPGVNSIYEFNPAALPTLDTEALIYIPGWENALRLPVDDGPELIETEPNDSLAQAQIIEVPGAVTGTIQRAGDEDHFSFRASKNRKMLFDVRSASLGFPLDAWLSITDAKGAELVRNDDGITADPRLEWTAPDDGTFGVTVGSVIHRGGDDYRYHLRVSELRPTFRGTISESRFTLEPGKTNQLKPTFIRENGYKGSLRAVLTGLPAGVKAEAIDVPAEPATVEMAISLRTAVEAKPWGGPVRITITDTNTGQRALVGMTLVNTTVNNGVPNGYTKLPIETEADLWLTIPPPKPAPTAPSPPP